MTNKIRDIRDMILNNPDKKLNFKYNACVLARKTTTFTGASFRCKYAKTS